jgi:hypothetical protein
MKLHSLLIALLVVLGGLAAGALLILEEWLRGRRALTQIRRLPS